MTLCDLKKYTDKIYLFIYLFNFYVSHLPYNMYIFSYAFLHNLLSFVQCGAFLYHKHF